MKFYQEWKAYANGNESEAFDANVPGCVQSDYAKANGFGDVNYGYNVKQFDKIEDYSWTYQTELQYSINSDERLFFVSKGIDYEYIIYLNDNEIYRHEGMFKSVELDLTDMLSDRNVLKVEIMSHPKREGAVKNDRMEADRSTKPPVSYGWDWHPRLIVSGIWDDTYLESRKANYIRECEASYSLSDDFSKAVIDFKIDSDVKPEIEISDPKGNVIYSGNETHITVNDPMLWWCNGQGDANLYAYKVRTSSCEKQGTIGFRKIELVMNGDAWSKPYGFPKSRSTPPITIKLNGREIFAKGVNWVNPEIFIGEITAERYEELIKLAHDADMNILRSWGGAFVNKDSFFDLCDKYGLMVWQEFPLACNNYEGEHYLKTLEDEASAIIRRVRKHPCHVIWCGGNELFNSWSLMTDQSLALRLLNKLCYELDRDKPFIMTSPLMGMAHGGYLFYDEESGRDVYETFNASENTAYTEFGIPSASSYETIKEVIPQDELDKIEEGTAWELHHGFKAWKKDTWLNIGFLEEYFGAGYTLEERIAQSEWLQGEGLKYIFEEARRQKPVCSMAISWCFNEPWKSVAGSVIVSYPAKPKNSYYDVAKAMRPTLASARIGKAKYACGEVFSAELWLLNDSTEIVSDTVSAYIVIDGKEFHVMDWNTGEVEANCNKMGHRLQFILPDSDSNEFTLKLKSQKGYDSEYRLHLCRLEGEGATRRLN